MSADNRLGSRGCSCIAVNHEDYSVIGSAGREKVINIRRERLKKLKTMPNPRNSETIAMTVSAGI